MSAFQCSNKHISALASYAMMHNIHVVTGTGVTTLDRDIAKVLYDANVESLQACYGERVEIAPFRFEVVELPSAVQVIKACHCFAYQSCEFDGWRDSMACRLLEAIEGNALQHLPGYAEADWAIK